MYFLLLAACPASGPPEPEDTEARTCDAIEADLAAEAAAIQSCVDAADCGTVLTGTSCGCTHDLVARNDADTTTFYALMAEVGTCDIGSPGICDCPHAYGFDCLDAVCTWAYGGSGPLHLGDESVTYTF